MGRFAEALQQPRDEQVQTPQPSGGRFAQALREPTQTPEERAKLAGEMSHSVQEVSRETRATQELPELGEGGVLSGEDPMTAAKIAPVLLATTNPQEMAKILTSNFPNIGIQEDEKGNLIAGNNRTGVKVVINKPGISKLDIMQGLGIMAAFSPAGGASAAVKGVAAKAGVGMAAAGATETGIQAAQAAVGGEFDVKEIGMSAALGGASEMVGIVGRGIAARKRAKQLFREGAPTTEALKETARGLYGELDKLGAVVDSRSVGRLRQQLLDTAEKKGYDADIHPKIAAALRRVGEAEGPQKLTKIDTLRRVMKSAAQSQDPSEKRLGSILIGKIDDYLDTLKPGEMLKGKPSEIGPLYKDARQLWTRVKKAEMIEEVFTKAKIQASGFENGLRTQFRSILNSKKKRQGFTKDELNAMNKVVKGGSAENMAKAIGKFGFNEGQATSMLLASLGIAGGAAAGGPAGAIAVPLIGQVSKKLAQKLTRKNAELADAVVRAGNNGRAIVKEYVKAVPQKEQNLNDLIQLLMKPGINLSTLKKVNIKQRRGLVADAVFYAGYLQKENKTQETER